MSSLNNTSGFCVFCYRSKTTHINKMSKELFKRFAKFVSRFVCNGKQNKIFKRFEELVELKIPSDNLFNSCDDCKIIVEGFCEEYHKLKCLEMQLEWKLDKFVRIIKLANLVPSRLSEVNKVLDDNFLLDKISREKSHKSIIKFRRTIAKAGQQRQKISQPRVLMTNFSSSHSSGLSNANENINNEITYENNDIADSLDFDITETPGNPKDPLQPTELDRLTEKTWETCRISISSPTPNLSIENIILNTFPTNGTNELILKTELGHTTTATSENIQDSGNLEDSDTHLSIEDEQLNEIEQKPTSQLVEQSQRDSSDALFDNVILSTTSTSTQQRYSLRKKQTPKLEPLNETISDQDNNFNANEFSSSDNSVDETDLTSAKRRGRKELLESTKTAQSTPPCKRSYQKDKIQPEIINGFTRFRCKFCKLLFKVVGELKRHIRELHRNCQTNTKSSKVTKNFNCKFCDSQFEYAPDT